jgi:hypothetical protein
MRPEFTIERKLAIGEKGRRAFWRKFGTNINRWRIGDSVEILIATL